MIITAMNDTMEIPQRTENFQTKYKNKYIRIQASIVFYSAKVLFIAFLCFGSKLIRRKENEGTKGWMKGFS